MIAARLEKYLTDLRTLPGDAASAWRRERWTGLWEAVAPRTVYRVFRHGRLMVYAQPVGAARDVPPPVGVTITPLREEHWPALGGLLTRRELTRFRTLAARGHHCSVAWRGSRPIGYAWVALRMGPEVSELPLSLPPEAAYLWDLYVVPEERNTGVGSALAVARLRVAREHGRSEGWRMIEPANAASLRTLARSGAGVREVGEMRYVKLLARVRARFRPAPDTGARR